MLSFSSGTQLVVLNVNERYINRKQDLYAEKIEMNLEMDLQTSVTAESPTTGLGAQHPAKKEAISLVIQYTQRSHVVDPSMIGHDADEF